MLEISNLAVTYGGTLPALKDVSIQVPEKGAVSLRMYELGFASRLVEHGEAVAEGERVAKIIAQNAPLPVVASKKIVRQLEDGVSVAEKDQAALSHKLFAEILESEDAHEGPVAFAQKRAPVWKGQ